MLCAEYHDAHVAARNAERAWRDADDQYRRERSAAEIWVPYTGNGWLQAKVGGNYREVEIGVAEHQLRKDREAALAAAIDGNARRSVRARYARLQKKIQAADDRCKQIRVSTGLEAAIDHDCDARRCSYAAKDALMAFRPETLEEVAAITRCLFLTSKATERFSEFPAWQLSVMLNPDLGERANV
jgi:hypothetical protein